MGTPAGVKRQYVGCAGKVANAVNVVYASYASPRGHALVGARLYLPDDWAGDPDRRERAALPQAVTFKTKPALGIDLLSDLHTAGRLPAWVTADEVYGRDPALRGFCDDPPTATWATCWRRPARTASPYPIAASSA